MSGIYIHVPFCASKCAYCDFYSLARKEYEGAYVERLIEEIYERRGALEGVKTIYLGGGTPSSLGRTSLRRIFDAIGPGAWQEVTIEVNPEDITEDYVSFLKGETPVDRVSMGVQSLSDEELSYIGRRHDSRQALRAYEILRVAYDNISLDLIYGLPLQTQRSWGESLEVVLGLRPEHLSAYSLTYEDGTRLTARVKAGRLKPTSDDEVAAMYGTLIDKAREAGYEHYEISNFALPGRRSKHNSSYWDVETEYLGLGPGAHSFLGGKRYYNPSNLKGYLERRRGFWQEDPEGERERFNDYVITALRTRRGLDLADCERRFGADYATRLTNDAQRHLSSGGLELNERVLTIPEAEWLKSDAVMIDLIL